MILTTSLTDGGGPATLGAFVDGAGIPAATFDCWNFGYLAYSALCQTTLLRLNNGVATTVAAGSNFSASDVNENYIQPTAALAGAQIDVYLIVYGRLTPPCLGVQSRCLKTQLN